MGLEVEALVAGDSRSWESFVASHRPSIQAVVARVLRSGSGVRFPSEDVEDVVQDVFARLCRNDFRLLRGFDASRAPLPTWIAAIARNTSIDFLRRRRLETVPLEEGAEPPTAPLTPGAGGSLELPTRLLSGRQQLVLHLLYDRDLSVAEVARLLRVEEQTVRSTRHKAICKLRRHLGD